MDILFLGTSAGTPTKERNVTGIALIEEKGKGWYLIDCGEGTQHQLLHTSLSLNALEAILITHAHGDHCYGLPGLLASAGMQGRKKPLTIMAPQGVQEWIESTQKYTGLYLPYELNFILSNPSLPQKMNQFFVNTIKLSHRVPSYAYQFIEVHPELTLNIAKLQEQDVLKGPVWGKLKNGLDVEYNGKTLKGSDYLEQLYSPRAVIIAGDNDNPELLSYAVKNSQLLVHEATFTQDISEKVGDVGHSSAYKIASFAEQTHLPNLLLTHFSSRYQLNEAAEFSMDHIWQEAQAAFKGQLFLAKDFDRYRLERSGQVIKVE